MEFVADGFPTYPVRWDTALAHTQIDVLKPKLHQ